MKTSHFKSDGIVLGVLLMLFRYSQCLQQRHMFRQSSKDPCHHPPLIVVVGTAQTAASWAFHLPALSRDRSVLIYEPLGLGPLFDSTATPDVSLRVQAERLLETAEATFPDYNQELDLVGFSLGGRIAMAVAASESSCAVRKLHLTGVGLQRSAEGMEELDHWRRLLRQNDLPGFARAAIHASYHQLPSKLPLWIEGVCQNHKADGLLALLDQAHDENGPYSVAEMAGRLDCKTGQLVVGKHDRLAPQEHVAALGMQLGWPAPIVVDDSGHAVPMEESRQWRTCVLDFLNNDG